MLGRVDIPDRVDGTDVDRLQASSYNWYHINELLRAIQESAFSLQQVNEFLRGCNMSGRGSVNGKFLEDRWNPTQGGCFRGTATDCKIAVMGLAAFAQVALVPSGLLPGHCRCIQVLSSLFEYYCLGDNILKHLTALDEATDTYVNMVTSLSQ